jgi:Domain of unknown function (DUF3943)
MRAPAAGVAMAIALAGLPASAQQEVSPTRYHLLPPYADPAFPRTPVPPPDKNYWIPLAEVILVNTGIWAYNYVVGKDFAKISGDSIKQNFNKGWIVDTDDFWANQLLHPVHGNVTFNAARSMGLNFYESFGYSFLGSLMWEQFYEIQPPSLNDQVNTPFGGSLLGESLFRISRLILDSGGYAPSAWRQFFALLVNPAAGVNRLMFGDRYRGDLLLPASWMGEFRFGSLVAGSSRNGAQGARDITVGPWASFAADVIYGIPGTPDLSLSKPFDHFTLSASVSLTGDITAQPTASLLVRGLLLGEPITLGGESGGLWGLFTSYDFIGVTVLRVGGFGLGPGVSLMKRWDWFELHGTALAEFLPWAGGGSTVPLGVRDYHYGPGGDLVLEFRGHFGDRVVARLTGRQYWVSGAYSSGQSEDISYGQAQVTVRVYDMHGVSAALDWAHRQAKYPGQPDAWQRGSIVTLYYTLLQGW